MKRLTLSLQLLLLFTSSAFIFYSCSGIPGKIPYDEKNVDSSVISIELARQYTASYRGGKAELQRLVTDSSFLNKQFSMPTAVSFNRDVLSLLLNQDSAKGVRMYFARNKGGEITLVLVPYDHKGNDIVTRLIKKDVVSIPGISPAFAQSGGQAVDNAGRCPDYCDDGGSGLGGN